MSEQPPRRRRRAVGGTAPDAEPEPRAEPSGDVGWGTDAWPDQDDEDRILREKPPHW